MELHAGKLRLEQVDDAGGLGGARAEGTTGRAGDYEDGGLNANDATNHGVGTCLRNDIHPCPEPPCEWLDPVKLGCSLRLDPVLRWKLSMAM